MQKSGYKHEQRENLMWRWRQASGQCFDKSEISTIANKPSEVRRKIWNRFFLSDLRSPKNPAQLTPWSHTSSLLFCRKIHFCCISQGFCYGKIIEFCKGGSLVILRTYQRMEFSLDWMEYGDRFEGFTFCKWEWAWACPVKCWRKSDLGRRKSMCKGPEVGENL